MNRNLRNDLVAPRVGGVLPGGQAVASPVAADALGNGTRVNLARNASSMPNDNVVSNCQRRDLTKSTAFAFALSALAFSYASTCRADTFGSGLNQFDIDFVRIGNPGNPPDANPNPAGAVPYSYRIGTYEVSEQMIDKANALGGLGITIDSRGPNKPATSVTWLEAAKFVNWLNTSTGSTPAYKFDGLGAFQVWQPGDPGYNPSNLYRNKLARYVLPSLNEWHKAAYHDPVAGAYNEYPTGSDSIPDGIDFVGDAAFDAVFDDGGMNAHPNDVNNVGLFSDYGTAGQGGNVLEWEETAFDRVNNFAGEQRSDNGGSWLTAYTSLAATHTGIGVPTSFQSNFIGFRVASIPEPITLLLGLLASVLLVVRRSR